MYSCSVTERAYILLQRFICNREGKSSSRFTGRESDQESISSNYSVTRVHYLGDYCTGKDGMAAELQP